MCDWYGVKKGGVLQKKKQVEFKQYIIKLPSSELINNPHQLNMIRSYVYHRQLFLTDIIGSCFNCKLPDYIINMLITT